MSYYAKEEIVQNLASRTEPNQTENKIWSNQPTFATNVNWIRKKILCSHLFEPLNEHHFPNKGEQLLCWFIWMEQIDYFHLISKQNRVRFDKDIRAAVQCAGVLSIQFVAIFDHLKWLNSKNIIFESGTLQQFLVHRLVSKTATK